MIAQANSIRIPLASESVQCCVTSPPYWGLRKYADVGPTIWGGSAGCGHEWGDDIPRAHKTGDNSGEWQRPSRSAQKYESSGQFCRLCGAWRGCLGLEPTLELYVEHLVGVFREVRRVLRNDGTAWLNLGDSYASPGKGGPWDIGRTQSTSKNASAGAHQYAKQSNRGVLPGLKAKDLCGIPWRVALALQADGWWLRSDIIWAKPNPMPESVTDRPTRSHEYVFLLAKGQWKTTVVKVANLPSEFVHLIRDFGSALSYLPSSMISIRLATSLLNFAQLEYQFTLSPFDPQVREYSSDDLASIAVARRPIVHWAATLAARFLGSYIPAKDFLYQFNRLAIRLSEYDQRLMGGSDSVFPSSPAIHCDGETTITINDSGDICKFDFIHGTIITRSHKGCKYYYDADAVRETSITNDPRKPYGSDGAWSLDGRDKWQEGAGKPQNRDVSTRNRRTVWTIATSPYSGAHFATFPPALVTPCILAGTSAKGSCPVCGAGWRRVVEKGPSDWETRKAAGATGGTLTKGHNTTHGNGTDHTLGKRESQTTGWLPTCDHDAEPTGAIILDPFCGSGTVGAVCRQLGRRFIGLDLSGQYLRELALPRAERKNTQASLMELPLFAEAK